MISLSTAIKYTIKKLVLTSMLLLSASYAYAINQVENINHTILAGGILQMDITLSEPLTAEPLSFTINNPSRVVLDLPDTTSLIPKKGKTIGASGVENVKVVTHKNRSRVVVSLSESLSYDLDIQNNHLYITFGSDSAVSPSSSSPIEKTVVNTSAASSQKSINNVDFRRTEKGDGQVLITLPDSSVPVDVFQRGTQIIADFMGLRAGEELIQRLDVLDFATPAKFVDITNTERGARVIITPINDNFEHLAYQSDDVFALEIKPLSKEIQEKKAKEKFGFTGERLSLNFQKIEVRSVLQLIADFTGLNIVVSDTVEGFLTLRLKNVPWDQALDIVLRTKGLDKRKSGNVLLIAPSEEIAEKERLALEALKQTNELAPLRTEFFQINYARAQDIADLIAGGNSVRSESGEERDDVERAADEATGATFLLSSRGSATADQRTNTLLITDTADSLDNIRTLLERIDVPVPQVLIEARIVVASDTFSKELGARFGITQTRTANGIITSGDNSATTEILNGDDITDRLNFNNPVADTNAGSAAVVLGINNGSLIELELSALQAEGRGEVVSTPRVVTSSQQTATITQGQAISFLVVGTNGRGSVVFRDVPLTLEATPQITPNDKLVIDIDLRQDNVAGLAPNGAQLIDTRQITTQVIVNNGETIVLGGVYVVANNDSVSKVPFFGDLPLLGRFFRRTTKTDSKNELLIFITPKILSDGTSISG